MQIGLKMEAGDCLTLNMNAKVNYLLSHSLKTVDRKQNSTTNLVAYFVLRKWIWWQILGFTTEFTRVNLKENYPTNLMMANLSFSN